MRHNLKYTDYVDYFAVYCVHCAVYCVHCEVYHVQFTLHSVLCILFSVQYTVYSSRCTMLSIHSIVCRGVPPGTLALISKGPSYQYTHITGLDSSPKYQQYCNKLKSSIKTKLK